MSTSIASTQTFAHSLADVFDDSTGYIAAKSSIAYSHVKADVAKPLGQSYTKRGVLATALMGAGAAIASIA